MFNKYADHIHCYFANMWQVYSRHCWLQRRGKAWVRTLIYIHWNFVTFTLHCIALRRTTLTATLEQYYLKTFGNLYVCILTS